SLCHPELPLDPFANANGTDSAAGLTPQLDELRRLQITHITLYPPAHYAHTSLLYFASDFCSRGGRSALHESNRGVHSVGESRGSIQITGLRHLSPEPEKRKDRSRADRRSRSGPRC